MHKDLEHIQRGINFFNDLQRLEAERKEINHLEASLDDEPELIESDQPDQPLFRQSLTESSAYQLLEPIASEEVSTDDGVIAEFERIFESCASYPETQAAKTKIQARNLALQHTQNLSQEQLKDFLVNFHHQKAFIKTVIEQSMTTVQQWILSGIPELKSDVDVTFDTVSNMVDQHIDEIKEIERISGMSCFILEDFKDPETYRHKLMTFIQEDAKKIPLATLVQGSRSEYSLGFLTVRTLLIFCSELETTISEKIRDTLSKEKSATLLPVYCDELNRALTELKQCNFDQQSLKQIFGEFFPQYSFQDANFTELLAKLRMPTLNLNPAELRAVLGDGLKKQSLQQRFLKKVLSDPHHLNDFNNTVKEMTQALIKYLQDAFHDAKSDTQADQHRIIVRKFIEALYSKFDQQGQLLTKYLNDPSIARESFQEAFKIYAMCLKQAQEYDDDGLFFELSIHNLIPKICFQQCQLGLLQLIDDQLATCLAATITALKKDSAGKQKQIMNLEQSLYRSTRAAPHFLDHLQEAPATLVALRQAQEQNQRLSEKLARLLRIKEQAPQMQAKL